MDVQVGQHVAPPGGPGILQDLDALLFRVNHSDQHEAAADPYQIHHEYETLHPFIDGNGRSGRALWAWQMVHDEKKNLGVQALGLGFLHLFYYPTLSAGR
jgi:Fic family protein